MLYFEDSPHASAISRSLPPSLPMDAKALPDLPSEAQEDDFLEISVSGDLLAMAALHGQYSIEEEDDWTEDSASVDHELLPEPGQIDIRHYFRPLPKEDIRVYFRPIVKLDRMRHENRPRLAVSVPKTKASVATKRVNGPIMSRPRPPYPVRAKSDFHETGRDREFDDRGRGSERPHARKSRSLAMRSRHSAWVYDGLPSPSPPLSSRLLGVPDFSLFPPPLRLEVSRHSPTSSEGDTLVNARSESNISPKSNIYGPLPALPIRTAKPKEYDENPPAYRRHRRQNTPYRLEKMKSLTTPYASSEALPSESRPTGTAALQLWAQEQRDKVATTMPPLAPKPTTKKGRSLLKPKRKTKVIMPSNHNSCKSVATRAVLLKLILYSPQSSSLTRHIDSNHLAVHRPPTYRSQLRQTDPVAQLLPYRWRLTQAARLSVRERWSSRNLHGLRPRRRRRGRRRRRRRRKRRRRINW